MPSLSKSPQLERQSFEKIPDSRRLKVQRARSWTQTSWYILQNLQLKRSSLYLNQAAKPTLSGRWHKCTRWPIIRATVRWRAHVQLHMNTASFAETQQTIPNKAFTLMHRPVSHWTVTITLELNIPLARKAIEASRKRSSQIHLGRLGKNLNLKRAMWRNNKSLLRFTRSNDARRRPGLIALLSRTRDHQSWVKWNRKVKIISRLYSGNILYIRTCCQAFHMLSEERTRYKLL